MTKEFNVSLKTLLDFKLSFEAYFILWCVRHKDKKLLIEYVENCGKISTEHFKRLEARKLIDINRKIANSKLANPDDIMFEMLSLTPSGMDMFKINVTDILFEEFKKCYPSMVKTGYAKRRLHTDMNRCKKLYAKIIEADIDKHKLMCQAAKMYYLEKDKANSLMYMQALPAWLEQANYEPYIEEIKKGESIEEEKTNVEGVN